MVSCHPAHSDRSFFSVSNLRTINPLYLASLPETESGLKIVTQLADTAENDHLRLQSMNSADRYFTNEISSKCTTENLHQNTPDYRQLRYCNAFNFFQKLTNELEISGSEL